MNDMNLIEKGATVLVADDDPMFCVMLKQFFEANGYAVITVEDGAQVVQAFEQQQPAMIMLDGDMPEMDGYRAGRAGSHGLRSVCDGFRLYHQADQFS